MNEDTFILNAARLGLSQENISVLKKIPSDNIDWTELERKACIHGVDTFIYYSLKNDDLSYLVPTEIFKRFQEHFYINAIRNSMFIEGIDTLSSIIDDKIILLKGSYLIQYLYPNIAIRSMCDIDILLEKAKENWNLLLKNGFSANNVLQKSSIHEKSGSHLIPLYSSCFTTEVHWNLFGGERLYVITKLAWAKSHKIKRNIYALPDEMLLIHLCVHFYKHLKFSSAGLRMLCDINELILNRSDTLNWGEIDEICTDPELRNEISTALAYTHTLLETPIPETFLNREIAKKQEITLDSLTTGNQKGILGKCLTILRTLERPSDRVLYVFRTFFPMRSWMDATYGANTTWKLPGVYCKYWLCLFRRHLLKQNIDYAG